MKAAKKKAAKEKAAKEKAAKERTRPGSLLIILNEPEERVNSSSSSEEIKANDTTEVVQEEVK